MVRQRIEPGPGQESVWDYPRPPRVEDSTKRVRVIFNGVTIADSERAKRVLETSHPPTYYIPEEDVKMEYLAPTRRRTWCEWKGRARYYAVAVGGRTSQEAAWAYPEPARGYEGIQGHLAFYAQAMDVCYVGDEQVQAQPGGFYGGWITQDIVGPFKGGPGTMGWWRKTGPPRDGTWRSDPTSTDVSTIRMGVPHCENGKPDDATVAWKGRSR